jgi:hypothetical protein
LERRFQEKKKSEPQIKSHKEDEYPLALGSLNAARASLAAFWCRFVPSKFFAVWPFLYLRHLRLLFSD